jgi:hypothetical protein
MSYQAAIDAPLLMKLPKFLLASVETILLLGEAGYWYDFGLV